MKKIFFIVILGSLVAFLSCSGSNNKNISKDIESDKDVQTNDIAGDFDNSDLDIAEDKKENEVNSDVLNDFYENLDQISDSDIKADLSVDWKGKKYQKTCTTHEDCVIPCGKGQCDKNSGTCIFVPAPDYCVLPVDDSHVSCFARQESWPAHPCLYCNPEVKQDKWSSWYAVNRFEDGLGSAVVKDLSGSGIAWHVSEKRAANGKSSVYLGDENTGTYKSDKRVWSSIEQKFNIPNENATFLAFFMWMKTEQTQDFDFLTLTVKSVDDTNSKELFNSNLINSTTFEAWKQFNFDLSDYAGKDVILTFTFDTKDAKMNSFEGVYLDDIRLVSQCCFTNFDCDDLNPCTDNSCKSDYSGCVKNEKPDCCATDKDCDDYNVCSIDKCSGFGGKCSHEFLDDCCSVDKDCDDNNDCTEDICPDPGMKCKYKILCCEKDSDCNDDNNCTQDKCNFDKQCDYIPICCTSDADCDDNDLCTKDVCAPDGDCKHKPAFIPGCCFPDFLTENFDSQTPSTFTFSSTDSTVGWHYVTNMKNNSAPGSLYYGDPAKQSYFTDSENSGEAISTQFILPHNFEITLEFDAWMSIGDWYPDDFKVYVIYDNKDYMLWYADYDTPMQTFIHKSIDISSFGGKPVQIKFYFATDGWTEDEGVYIDNFKIHTTCTEKQCNTDSDCKTFDSCTGGKCKAGACLFSYICCTGNDDCNDNDVCTEDVCGTDKKCKNTPIKECCTTVKDCNDNNPCTTDSCPGAGEFCTHDQIAGCCVNSGDCDDSNQCTQDVCKNNECTHTDICCTSDSDCDDNDDKCTIDKCVNNFCKFIPTFADGCCSSPVVDFDFEQSGATDMEIDPAVNGVGWQVVNGKKNSSPTHSLYYGNPETGNFDNGSVNTGTVKIKNIVLTPGVDLSLEFDVYMDTEYGTTYDALTISVAIDDKQYQVWDKSDLDNMKQWEHHKIDISSLAGKTIDIIIYFDSHDSVSNSTEGAYLDDIKITSNCNAKQCTSDKDCPAIEPCINGKCTDSICVYSDICCKSDAECNDNDLCTKDTCSNGKCSNKHIDECCMSEQDCNDDNQCTIDSCPGAGQTCVYSSIDGCCLSSADCNDNDDCTKDTCIDNKCNHTNVCCNTDSDCDDGDDKCTIDSCKNGKCHFEPTFIEGCCVSPAFIDDAENGIGINVQFDPLSSGVGWQIADGKKYVSPTHSFYYGNLSTGNYDTGYQNSGAILFKNIKLKSGVDYQLSFSLYMDTESGSYYDDFTVYVIYLGEPFEVWSKSSLKDTTEWDTYSADLSSFAGKTIDLKFFFDTSDSYSNDGEGVYLDDVQIESNCVPKSCIADKDCDDGFYFSTDTCEANVCSYKF